METQYDFSMLQRLAQCESPIVGISRPGEHPFAFRRSILAKLIEDLPASTVVKLNGRLEIRTQLRSYTLNPLPMNTARSGGWTYEGEKNVKELRRWAESKLDRLTRPKRSKADTQKANLEKRIAIEERKAEKMNPGNGDHLYNLDLHGSAFMNYYRADLKKWREQKEIRRKLGIVARNHGLKNGHYLPVGYTSARIADPRRLYGDIYGIIGRQPRKYGEIHETSRISKPSIAGYLSHLYEHCGLIQKPYCLTKFGRDDWHSRDKSSERKAWAAKRREWKNQLAYIQYLRNQLVSFDQA